MILCTKHKKRVQKKPAIMGLSLICFFPQILISYINQAFMYVIFRYILKKESCTTVETTPVFLVMQILST